MSGPVLLAPILALFLALTPTGGGTMAQGQFPPDNGPCIAGDQHGCLWRAASDGDHQKRKQLKDHAGEEGLIGQDGQPVPDHLCTTCHTDTDPLPPDHLPTTGITLRGCVICHGTDKAAPLPDRLFQSHTHFFAGVGCAGCHQDPDQHDTPTAAICKTCHGTLDDLARQTADVPKANPHASPHGEPFAECSRCHSQHKKPQDFCASCHDFGFTLP